MLILEAQKLKKPDCQHELAGQWALVLGRRDDFILFLVVIDFNIDHVKLHRVIK